MPASPLPPPLRFVTTTSPNTGESSHLIAAPVAMVTLEGSETRKGDVWLTNKFPAEVMGGEDVAGTGIGMISRALFRSAAARRRENVR